LIRLTAVRDQNHRVMNSMLIKPLQITLSNFKDSARQAPDDGVRRQQIKTLDAILIGSELNSHHGWPQEFGLYEKPQGEPSGLQTPDPGYLISRRLPLFPVFLSLIWWRTK